ncbi:hypothetical protein GCM10009530_26000 [Microbispora corallina]|uniref:Uncharacterized protein n=1 Tax=Microbispora corallina TaxID=83302 RepID=A0ABQ4G3U0_9ACTN|nr:hypothetical protein Mco01_47310 [Microbispora corallina]
MTFGADTLNCWVSPALTLIWVAKPTIALLPAPGTSHWDGGVPGRLFSRQMIELGGHAARKARVRAPCVPRPFRPLPAVAAGVGSGDRETATPDGDGAGAPPAVGTG